MNCCGNCLSKLRNCLAATVKPFSRNSYEVSADDGFCKELCYNHLLCPPIRKVNCLLSATFLLLCIFVVLWSTLGSEALSPSKDLFKLFVLFTVCHIFGAVAQAIRLPPLFGMLLAGFLLANVPNIDIASNITPAVASQLRQAAFAIVLLQAGVGLDLPALMRLKATCIRLAFVPCLAEAVTVGIVGHFILGMPWLYSFMLGFILGAVSPAILVPCMLFLQNRGFGVTAGIPTLVIAASSIDDVLAITVFSVLLQITFSKGDIVKKLLQSPIEVLLGILYGLVFGIIMWFLPDTNSEYLIALRLALLIFVGFVSMFGSIAVNMAGAGALGCIMLAVVANWGWTKRTCVYQNKLFVSCLDIVWLLVQPFLFGLIGAELKVSQLSVLIIGRGFATLFIGLVVRTISTMLVLFGTEFSMKERIFISFAWLPKATVQAALAPSVLDTARQMGLTDNVHEELGTQILTLSVLSILMTAPLGALAVVISGPRLLNQTNLDTDAAIDEKDDIGTTGLVDDEQTGFLLEELEPRQSEFSMPKQDNGDDLGSDL